MDLMCGMLDSYLQEFSKLRTDTNRNKWTEATNFKSPYKPFLLLSILDLIGYGSITKNFIEPSFELTETFQRIYQSASTDEQASKYGLSLFLPAVSGFMVS